MATAAPPFLWTGVDSPQAQGIATVLSEDFGRVHDFAPWTFLGSRISAGAPNHPFSLGAMTDFDDKGFESESRHSHRLPASNGSSVGNASIAADSVLDRLSTSAAPNGSFGRGGGSVAKAASDGPNGNQSSGAGDNSDPPDPPVSTVPLPSALLLFATGLGGLGLLGWRRKRKAAV
jgi:hypothetical protein